MFSSSNYLILLYPFNLIFAWIPRWLIMSFTVNNHFLFVNERHPFFDREPYYAFWLDGMKSMLFMTCCYPESVMYVRGYFDFVLRKIVFGSLHDQVNSLQLKIGRNILQTVLHTFPKVLTRRICLTIKSFFSWWSFPFILMTLGDSGVIIYKLDASHSQRLSFVGCQACIWLWTKLCKGKFSPCFSLCCSLCFLWVNFLWCKFYLYLNK